MNGELAAVDPVEELRLAVRAGYAPPPELAVSEFSDRELIVTTGPLAGTHWQTSFAEYQRGILDVFHEPGVEIAVVMGSSQWGKTACAVNVCAYHMKHDPCPILVVEPTVKPMAEDFSKNRLEPVIAASPSLLEVVGKRRAKDASNTTLAKTFTGGSIAIGGANSAASLAARSTRLLIMDEVDRYPAELPGEGSTIAVALKRTTAYRGRRRVLMLSSPTLRGGTIDTWHKRGDQRRFYVPCIDCGHLHPFEWRNVKWVDGNAGTAMLHCPECDYGMSDGERVAVLSRGEWRPTIPPAERTDPSIVSFHLWEAYSPLSSLREIVAGFLRARKLQKAGDRAEMHTWQNTTLGAPIEAAESVGVEPSALLKRREAFGACDVPPGGCCVTVGVDVQDDRLELLANAWGPGEESWVIDRRILPGDTSQPGPWALLDQALEREYLHAGGLRLPIETVCIDSAGNRTTVVYEWVARKQARRVMAIIGRAGQRPIVSAPTPRKWGAGQRTVPLYTVGVDAAKALLVSRLALDDHGPGYIHLPHAAWADEELAAQLTSERLETRHVRGVAVQGWVKTRKRNEALDCWVYSLAALRLLNPSLELLLARLKDPAAQPRPTPAPPKKQPWIDRGRGRRGGGRWLR